MSSPVPDDGVRARQRQLAGDLRALILSGDIAPGSRLPSTAELTRRYGVNNMSVTRAIAILKAEGLVEGQRGRAVLATHHRPTVVKAAHYPDPAAPGESYPWITDNAARGRSGSSELIEVGERPATAQVAAAFGIAPGDAVVVRHQVLLLDGHPAELVWTHYPVDVARGTVLAQNRRIKGGSPAALAALGHPLRNAVDQVAARFATVAEFIALRLPEDVPVLRQFRVAFDDTGRAVEATIMIKSAQHYEVQYDLPESSTGL
ncbi:GntR family transcriptional regulator [Krasilnikovia sp. MM14-A1004]|uniref:GntR family transcriptional regulator n=1 Tax=Krasilnikovia sp. MM14-A1004 TaxID=3373541 RepID=UPI00399C6F46